MSSDQEMVAPTSQIKDFKVRGFHYKFVTFNSILHLMEQGKLFHKAYIGGFCI